jgi:plastocyanin
MKRLLVVLVVLALVPLSLGACGGDDDDDGGEEAATTTEETTGGGGGGGGEATTLKLSADPGGAIAYDTDSLEAPAGDVTIDFDNPANLAHDVCLESPAGDEVGCSDTVTDDSTSLDAKVESGDYTFFCSVDGHRQSGMEGTLTVQ